MEERVDEKRKYEEEAKTDWGTRRERQFKCVRDEEEKEGERNRVGRREGVR